MVNTATGNTSLNPAEIPVGVVGLGVMGTSITACLLAAGHPVAAVTPSAAEREAIRPRLLQFLQELVDEGRLDESPDDILQRLVVSDDYAVLAGSRLVTEVVIEDLEIKRQVIRSIEDVVVTDAVIASNTSAIPITDLQQGALHPERIIGMHWCEPAHFTRLMEVTCGAQFDPELVQWAVRLADIWGKETALLKKDVRGFLANRVGYAMIREALHLVETGVATPADIDRALMTSLGTWSPFAGPFRMMDMYGVTTFNEVMKGMFPELSNAQQPPALLQEMIDTGTRGMVDGRGFYDYGPDTAQRWDEAFRAFNRDIDILAREYAQAKVESGQPIISPLRRRANASIIKSARATPVRVPAKPDSLQSPGIEADDPELMKLYKAGTTFASVFEQVKWIIELEASDGTIGIGETYRATEGADVEAAMQAVLGQDVLALDWRRLPVVEPRVYDGIEAAVLDLAGHLLGVPVYQLLGGKTQDSIECSGWAGRRSPEDGARKAREAMDRGHRVFKFKCSDTDPVRLWCESIVEACGTGIKILLDPNQRWRDVETTMRLMEGVPEGIMFGLEDPVGRHDYAAFRELRERLQIPIFLHIAVPYRHMGQRPEDIIPALRERCADGFNFNGPMFEFVRLASIAALEGLPVWHGSEVDCGILEAAALHAAAASPNCTIPCDIFGELVRVDDLITEGIGFERGRATVPTGPGLGISLDREAVTRFQDGAPIELHI